MASPAQTACPKLVSTSHLETVSELFEHTVQSSAVETAIQYESSRILNYQEVRHLVDVLVTRLHDTVERGQMVLVLLPRSIQQICVILAIAKLGAVYVPVDAGLSDAGLCRIISFVGGGLIVTTSESKQRLREVQSVTLEYFDPFDCLGETSIPRVSVRNPTTQTVQSHDLAAVLFTSGSTGRPKGVMLSHRNLIEPVRLLSRMENIGAGSRILQFARCAFDVHLLDIFCALLNGAVLCLVSHDKLTSDLPRWVEAMDANVVHLTPSVISFLDCNKRTPLRYMVTCGEPVTRSIIQDWSNRVVLINLFGPCEASSIIARRLAPDSDPRLLGTASCHASIHVLDESGRSVGTGVEGEIYASGDSVALGYLNDKATTRRSFHVASSLNSYTEWKGSYAYATGDYGSLNDAGKLILHGRRDHMVKISGQRVDLAEIQALLTEYPIQYSVLAIRDPNGQMRIFGFVSRERAYNRSPATLVDDLALVRELYSAFRVALPSYMIPRFVVVSAIPLNASDKIDHKQLSELVTASLDDKVDATRTINTNKGIEEVLANVVASRSFGNLPSTTDDLKEYGLTSLDFMGIIKDIEKNLGVSLTLSQILHSPNIRSFIHLVKTKSSRTPAEHALAERRPSCGQTAGQTHVECVWDHDLQWIRASVGQRSIFEAQNRLRNSAYSCNFILRVKSFPLHEGRLISALQAICARHEVLRSTYHVQALFQDEQGAACWQKIHPVEMLGPVCHVAGIGPLVCTQNIEEILTSIEADAWLPFDLHRDSPVRMTIYQVSPSKADWVLHFNIHHIAIDEWGFSIMLRELEDVYRTVQQDDRFVPRHGEPPQHRQMRLYEQAREADDQVSRRLKWWLHILDKATCKSLTSERLGHRLGRTYVRLEKDESYVHTVLLDGKQVRRFEATRCSGLTPFVGWLSLCEVILARMTQRKKFMLHVPVSERGMDPNFQEIVGFCLNTLLVPVDLDENDTFEAILRSTKRTLDACTANALPFSKVVEALSSDECEPRKVRPEVSFAYHDFDRTCSTDQLPLGFLQSAESMQLTRTGSRFDLEIHYAKKSPNDSAELKFEFRRSLFNRQVVEAIGRSFEAALHDIVTSDRDERYSRINCVSIADEALMDGWSLTTPVSERTVETRSRKDGILLHQLVESIASRRPQALAIITPSNDTITYGELMSKAQTLAAQMQENDLEDRTTIVLFLWKSPQLVVAELAVLMAGFVFAVLDPRHDSAINRAKVEACLPGLVLFESTTHSALLGLNLSRSIRTFNISSPKDQVGGQKDPTPHVDCGAYLRFILTASQSATCHSTSHAAAVAAIISSIEEMRICPEDRVGMIGGMTGETSLLEIFGTLAAGATLCVTAEREVIRDQLRTLEVSHLFATPSLISLLSGPPQLPYLRFVCLWGEPATASLLRLWAESVDLRQAYHPAGATLFTHSCKITTTDDWAMAVQRMGRPLPNFRSLIVDDHGNLAIPGTTGHLHIGPCRADGFDDDWVGPFSSLRPASYTDHPKFGRLYKTGDLAFHTFDGELHLVGPQDSQIELHGLETNLREIERSIQKDIDRRVAAILCRAPRSSHSGPVIALFVQFALTSDETTPLGQSDSRCPWLLLPKTSILETLCQIRQHATEELPDILVPTFWFPIWAFPHTDVGCVDYETLSSWSCEILSHSELVGYEMLSGSQEEISGLERIQRTALGQILIEDWKSVFRVAENSLSAEVTFLHTGGDSISAIRFVSSLRNKGILGVSVSMLYESPTLVQLHNALLPHQSSPESPNSGTRVDDVQLNLESEESHHGIADFVEREIKALNIPQTAVARVYPATSMQRTMLIQSQSNPALYITRAILSLSGKLDSRRMAAGWRAVCDAHPAMNTTFARTWHNAQASFYSLELNPSTITEPARVIKNTGPLDVFGDELETDLARGFEFGGSMFRLSIIERTEQIHKVVLSCHHAICDGWSLNHILRDLARAYQGHRVSPTRSFADAVDYDQGRDKSTAKSYWRRYLENYNHRSLLWGSPPQHRSTEMRSTRHMIPSVSGLSLAKLARECAVTPAAILMAAWSMLLSNAVSKDDVAFGVVVSGRDVSIDGAVDLIGNFLNTIPLRVIVDRSLDRNVWLQRVHRSSTDSLEHHHLAVEEIIRQSDCAQILETVVVFENQPDRLESSAFGCLRLGTTEGQEFSEIPLTVVLEFIDGGGLMITFKFNSAIFPVWRVEYMAKSYTAILSDMLAGCPVEDLGRSEPYDQPLIAKLSADRSHQQLQPADDDTLISLFAKTVQNFPERSAVEVENGFVTFREVSGRSDAARDHLLSLGVVSGEFVPIVFTPSIEMIVAILGILKAGAAYCPVDVDSPEARIREVVKEVGARMVVGDHHYRERLLHSVQVDLGYISVEEIVDAGRPSEAACPLVTPQHDCYVFFTSGSTGDPKGCPLNHSAASNAVLQTSKKTEIGPGSRVLLYANYIFDASVIDIFGCLVNGATLCLSARFRLLNDLESVIRTRRINHVHLTPSVAQKLSPDACPSLQTLVLGGEKVPLNLCERWARRVKVYDGYGLTECAVQVSTTLVSSTADINVIFEPLPGNLIFLLDKQGKVPRIGEIGEICIGGKQVFRGYLHPPKQEVRKTLKFFSAPADSLFATGDLGVYRPDMAIQFLGREDNQVKLSGERFELEELESIILSVGSVVRCAVLVEQNQLHAIVQANENDQASVQVSERCLARLPKRFLPRVHVWSELPLSTSGKIDRQATLRKFRERQKEDRIQDEDKPRTEAEHAIASIVGQMSGHRPKDATLSLNHCGLNSMDALHVRLALAERYGFFLELSDFLLAGSIRSLATLIDERVGDAAGSANHDVCLQATSPQLAIWMGQQRYPDSSYNVGRVLCLHEVELNHLVASIRLVIQTLDAFKITFEWDFNEERLRQRMNADLKTGVTVHEMQGYDDVETVVRKICEQDFQTVFDLESGPLARFHVFATSSKECYFFYTIHHILVDEWSCEMLLEAIVSEYLCCPWSDTIDSSWIASDTECHHGESLERWKAHLNGAVNFDTTSWPQGDAENNVRSARSTSICNIPLPVLQRLGIGSGKGGSSLFIVLLSAFNLLMHQYTSSASLITLIPVSRRGFDAQNAKTFGNMTHTTAVKSNVAVDDTFMTFFERVTRSVIFARANSSVLVDKALGAIASTVSEHSVMFVYNKKSVSSRRIPFTDFSRDILLPTSTIFDLLLTVIERDDGLEFAMTFNAGRFAAAFVERLVASYQRLLEQIGLLGVNITLRKLTELPTIELEEVESFANMVTPRLPSSKALLHQAFESYAATSPATVAIESMINGRRTQVSYSELNDMAEQFAGALLENHGVNAGETVPIYVDQTPDLIIAIIGILKTGAGYTPIPRDGTWPVERMREIIRRCRANILITDTSTIPDLDVKIVDVHSQTSYVKARNCLADQESTAYTLWTSGTTGEPKGVMVSHRAAVSCISSIAGKLYPMSTTDRVFQFSSPVFDVSTVDYFATLSTGATLCMMTRGELVGDVNKAIAELRPTAASLTPSVAQLVDPKAARLKTLVLSGEGVQQSLRDGFLDQGTTLINAYGPTEGNIVTYLKMDAGNDIRSIGRPSSSARVAILDRLDNLVPTFVRGEIYIGGSNLFSGYQNRDDLTNSGHILHEKYGRLYKTGDLGFFDATGGIIFCGRCDSQTKLHGHRLETEGISSVISETSFVEGSAVSVIADQLVAFIVYGTNLSSADTSTAYIVEHQKSEVDQIRDLLANRLPSTSIPSLWLRVSRLPLTISGKLDIHMLRKLAKNAVVKGRDTYIGPDDHYERVIHKCCRHVLGKSISMTANMLYDGLDSYTAMALVARLRQALPTVPLSFRDVITNPVPRLLAALVRDGSPEDDATPPDTPVPYVDLQASSRVAASSMQQRFCLAQQIFQDATYNVPGFFEVSYVTIETVRGALADIVSDHTIFRTRFEFDALKGYQQVLEEGSHMNVMEYDLSSLSPSDISARIQDVLKAELARPFDITRLPLLRCTAFQKPNQLTCIFVNIHHSIIDEQSLKEFLADFSGKLRGLTLSPLPVASRGVGRMQYLHFCLLEKQKHCDAYVMGKSAQFWKQHLHGIDVGGLSSDVGRKSEPVGAIAGYNTSRVVSKHCFNWAYVQGMTRFSACLAYFQILLAQCCGCLEPATLIPISLRPAEYKDVYGCFLNTVPFHTSINAKSSFESVIQSCNKTLFEVIEHSFVPYESILQTAGFKADDFPFMFVYHEELPRPADVATDMSYLTRGLTSNVKPKFPLTFSVTVRREDEDHLLQLQVDYDPTKISVKSVERLCDQYRALVDVAASEGKKVVTEGLDLPTPATWDVLNRCQVQQAPIDIPRIHDLIEQRVRERSQRTACWFEADVKVTYQELWMMVIVISDLLLPYRAGRDGRVAIFIGPGTQRIAAMLATLRAGFAYVPLDLDWPTPRIAAVLRDSTPKVVLISSALTSKYRQILGRALSGLEMVGPLVSLPNQEGDGRSHFEGSAMPVVESSDLAYVMYTSGSTGTPKGVMIQHGALSNSLQEHCRILRLSSGSKLLQFAPWTFDVSVVDIFGTLARGAILCLGSKDFLLSRLQEAVNSMQITHLATTPTIATLLNPEQSPTIETLAVGGESMTKQVQEMWSTTVRLLNVYGPTETTVNVVCTQVLPESDVNVIGKPLRNVTACVLDERLQEVRVGSIGQLAIAGAQLAKGYTDEGLTQASFPTHSKFGRIYLTGDLAKFNNNGSIHCFGRIDNQVKLRGQRIELEEIEKYVGALPEVWSVVVTLLKTQQVEALCAAFSTRKGSGSNGTSRVVFADSQDRHLISRLETQVKTHMPHYAVPHYWIPLSAIPFNINGKLDRRRVHEIVSALTMEELALFTVQRLDIRPAGRLLESEKEKILGTCIAQVLGITEIFQDSNFFALSGDSISAIRLCSLAHYHGLDIVVSDIYQCPTVERLANVARSNSISETPTAKTAGAIYNTPIIERFFELKNGNPHWYSQTVAIRLNSIRDLTKLPSLWEAIIQVHPSLRIRLGAASRIEVLDPSRSRDTFSVELMRFESFGEMLDGIAKMGSCLRLDSGPVSALGLVQVAATGYCIFCVHHLAVDTVSWQVIFDDLTRLLRGDSILPEPVTFQDWSFRLCQQRQSKQHSWQDNLAASEDWKDVNSALFPGFIEKAHLNTAATARVVSMTSEDLTDPLTTFADRGLRAEPVDLLLASLLMAFSLWRGVSEIEICFESHGRDLANSSMDISRTVGWFTTIATIRFPISSLTVMGLSDMIAEVKDRRSLAIAGLDRSEPFPARLALTPLVFFNYQGSYSSSHGNDQFASVDIGQGQMDEDPFGRRFATMDIGCGINNGILTMSIFYSIALCTEDDANHLLCKWSACLRELLEYGASDAGTRDTINRETINREDPEVQPRVQIPASVQSSLESVVIDPSMVEYTVPATDMQKSLVLASQEGGTYIEFFKYRIRGSIESGSFMAAWSRVIAKHAALRSMFILSDARDSESKEDLFQVILTPEYQPPMLIARSQIHCAPKFEYGKPTMQSYLYQDDDGFQFIWHYHHALIDGWSAGIVLRDFQQEYMGHPRTTAVSFEAVRSKMKDASSDASLVAFWEQELQEVRPNRLVDHSRPPAAPVEPPGNWHYDEDLPYHLRDLHAYAAEQSTTVSIILRAAWAVTLAYFYGQEDVVFGATTSGRSIDVVGIEEVVGPCVNTIPCRIRVNGSDSMQTYLHKVHSKCASLVKADVLSLHRIHEISNKTDLFDTVFVYQNYAKFLPEPTVPFAFERVEAQETTDVPLNVLVSGNEAGRLHMSALLHGENFSQEFVESIFAAFIKALAWTCGQEYTGDTRIGDMSMLSLSVEQRLKSFTRGPPPRQPAAMAWHIFVLQEQQRPSENAIEFFSGEQKEILSYSDLRQLAEHGARYLHIEGIRCGSRVALYMDKSPFTVAIMLSLLRLGAICVPFHVSSPDERLDILLREVIPELIITCEEHRKHFSPGWKSMCVENILGPQFLDLVSLPEISCQLEDPAMILFTSGTTGVPKGVILPHRQVVGYADAMIKAYRYNRESRIFSFANYTFDVFITDVLGGLMAGSVVCFSDLKTTMNDFPWLLRASRSTHVNLTSSVAGLLDPDQLPDLQTLVLTGEAATRPLIRTWASKIHVVNSYGPTEAGVIAWMDVSPDSDPRHVGYVVAGMEVFILDDLLRQVPVGVQGTIYTCGQQLSLGYFNQPELTKKLFVMSKDFPGKLLYNTGDLGAFDSQGRLLHLGRRDLQVKIHGQRVELGEIEEVLAGDDGRTAAVAIQKPEVEQTQIVAFYECESPPEELLENAGPRSKMACELAKRCRQRLPSYMIPSAFIPVQRLSLTTNGKIDRARLREMWLSNDLPHADREHNQEQQHQQMTAMETKLHDAVTSLFCIPSMSIDTDLYAEGILDSLSSMRLTVHLRTVFERPIYLRWMIESRTIRNLATRVLSANANQNVPRRNCTPQQKLQMPPTVSLSYKEGGRKVFCIHPSSGLSYPFQKLAALLPEVSVIGINDPHFGNWHAYRSISDMASLYVSRMTGTKACIVTYALRQLETVLKLQADGHLTILGYSFGGHVAVEMARLLHGRRRSVQLILIDPSIEPAALEKFKSPKSIAAILESVELPREDGPAADEAQDFQQAIRSEVVRNLRLMSTYQMLYLPLEVTLLRAESGQEEVTSGDRDVSNGYAALVKELHMEHLLGDHFRVISEGYVSFNSQVIRRVLGI